METTSIGGIFSKIFDDKYAGFARDNRIIGCINHLQSDPTVCRHTYSDEELAAVRSSIVQEKEVIEGWMGNNKQTRDLFAEMIKHYRDMIEKHKTVIDRMVDNLKENSCQVCSLPLKEEGAEVIIMKCCNIIICSECCSSGTKFRKHKSSDDANI